MHLGPWLALFVLAATFTAMAAEEEQKAQLASSPKLDLWEMLEEALSTMEKMRSKIQELHQEVLDANVNDLRMARELAKNERVVKKLETTHRIELGVEKKLKEELKKKLAVLEEENVVLTMKYQREHDHDYMGRLTSKFKGIMSSVNHAKYLATKQAHPKIPKANPYFK